MREVDHAVLDILATGEMSLGELVTEAHATTGVISESLSFLVEEGLVQRDQDAYLGFDGSDDSVVFLTDRGQRVLHHH